MIDQQYLEMWIAENRYRKDLTPSEMFAAGTEIEGRLQTDHLAESVGSGKTRDAVGAMLRISGKQWDKIKAIHQSGFDDLKADLERHGRVDRVHRRVRQRLRAAELAAMPSPAPVVKQGDCRELLPTLETASVQATVSDLPFGIGFDYHGTPDVADNEDDYGRWVVPVYRELRRITAPGGLICLWQSDKYHHRWLDWFGPHQIFLVCKQNAHIHSASVEFVVMTWMPGAAPLLPPERDGRNYCEVSCQERFLAGLHPCPKSLDACKHVIRNWTIEGATVLDCCAGIATIPLAVQQVGEGRTCIAFERDAGYCDTGNKRLAGLL